MKNSNQSAEYWDSLADNILPEVSNDLWRQHADYINCKLVKRFLSGEKTSFERVLKTDLFDESLGEGLIPLLSKLSGETAGIDISFFTALRASKSQTSCLAVNASVTAPPFRSNSFDLIISNSTLDHFQSEEEIEESLGALARILGPGGHLIWTMDNPANPVVWTRNALTRHFGTIGSLVPYQMGKTWSLRKMARVTSLLGMEVKDTARIMHCPRFLVIQVLQYLKRKNSSGKSTFRFLKAMERLESLPTGPVTAHYSAVHAIKKSS
jgi:ubiquinone/menaquinone biosynthesis C-methylase UbiE